VGYGRPFFGLVLIAWLPWIAPMDAVASDPFLAQPGEVIFIPVEVAHEVESVHGTFLEKPIACFKSSSRAAHGMMLRTPTSAVDSPNLLEAETPANPTDGNPLRSATDTGGGLPERQHRAEGEAPPTSQTLRAPVIWLAMIGIDLEQAPGTYPVEMTWTQGGHVESAMYSIEVQEIQFATQTLTLPEKMVDLDVPTLARVKAEQERFSTLWGGRTPDRQWAEGFIVPVAGARAGTFGRRRVINGQAKSPHTGEDIAAPLGAPVVATQAGVVALVGEFYFNGHSVVIDHGMGLFSMYFHLLDVAVKPNEAVARGAVIGRVGQSGRATGPHLHWGARLGGARIDPFALLTDIGNDATR